MESDAKLEKILEASNRCSEEVATAIASVTSKTVTFLEEASNEDILEEEDTVEKLTRSLNESTKTVTQLQTLQADFQEKEKALQ